MLQEIGYNRALVYEYAKRWAYGRNPIYYNFDSLGGDCTNYASQCIFSGCGVMNYKPTFGWYYINLSRRTPSWTGVEFLYNFLIDNKDAGPYAEEVAREDIRVGDIVQLGNARGFYHSPVVCGISGANILVAAHTYDVFNKNLDSYHNEKIRNIHIQGAR